MNRSNVLLTINYSATDACALGLSTIIQNCVLGFSTFLSSGWLNLIEK